MKCFLSSLSVSRKENVLNMTNGLRASCYIVLTRPSHAETAVHGSMQFSAFSLDSTMSLSRYFSLRSISLASLLFYFYYWLIRSFTVPTYTSGPLPHLYVENAAHTIPYMSIFVTFESIMRKQLPTMFVKSLSPKNFRWLSGK